MELGFKKLYKEWQTKDFYNREHSSSNMGFLFNKKNKLHSVFNKIKQDIANISGWINYLKNNHEVLEHKHWYHVERTKKQSEVLHNRINELKKENEQLRKDFFLMMDYIKLLHNEFKQLKTAQQTADATLSDNYQPIEPIISRESREVIIKQEGLTKAERALVALLHNSKEPMTYKQLSELTGLSYGTLKNRMASIKGKGINVLYKINDKGERIFFLPEEEKIRVSGR